MSYVKGTALKTLPQIIKKFQKEQGYEKWMDSLSEEAQKIFTQKISSKKWYPLKDGLIEPSANYCILFHNWDFLGAWDLGRHSADFGLKGVHKLALRIGSPEFLIKKAGEILPSYYRPSNISVIELRGKMAMFEISNFPDLNRIIEYRIAGWMERALEISGCKAVEVIILESVEQNKSYSKIKVTWE